MSGGLRKIGSERRYWDWDRKYGNFSPASTYASMHTRQSTEKKEMRLDRGLRGCQRRRG
jgi:hypothetical protein